MNKIEIPEEKYNEIAKLIESSDSPVGIDAKKTHVIIIHKLMEIERRLSNLENNDVSKMKEIKPIISTDELRELIDNSGNYVLIDVREPSELEYGMIPSAINIPLDDIEFGIERFDKNDNLIFYCRTGGRSHQAAETAKRLGFFNSRNYKGSVWEWSKIDSNVMMYGPEPY
ncbi:MAG: rhodanese-like domain-containing protein [Nanoarchaeota archaeon]